MCAALKYALGALLLAAYVGFSSAIIRRVPQEYATIQAALDSVQDGDTVLVAVGTYAEALIGPAHSGYVLRGDVIADTGDYPRPIIDPSTLPRPDTVACLILNPLSRDIVIEDFRFRNGPEMYEIGFRLVGGIANHSENLTIRRCVFDSTYIGIARGYRLTLADCWFDHNRVTCAAIDSGPTHATICRFSCRGGGGWNVYAMSHSSFSQCEFVDNDSGSLLGTNGDSIVAEDCVFGPYGPFIFNPLELRVRTGCVLRRSVFTECRIGYAVLNLLVPCFGGEGVPIEISHNVFMNYQGGQGQGGMAISTQCDGGNASTFMGTIEDNVFEDGTSSPMYAAANALDLWGDMDVQRNRFTRLNPPTVPDVHGYRIGQGPTDTLTLRDNLLDSSGLAASAAQAWIDARWNWWGDTTGPYHPSLNPNGQGGEVGSNVSFDPWYPDTSFLSAPHPRAPLPQSVSLEVFPNPFNATATLKLVVSRPGIFDVSLYNLLGQRVAEIWAGAVAYEKSVRFDGSGLASGLYFVRVWQPIENRPVALQKMVIAK